MKLTVKEHGDKIKSWLSEGRSYRQIASDLGVSKDTVSIFAKVNFPELRRRPAEAQETATRESKVNVLIIDIETQPNLAYVWRVWDENVAPSQIVTPTNMISFAAKWLGDDVIFFKSEFHNGREEMVKFAWQLLDKADIVMHYNGARFDIPHLNREFVEQKLTPPSPYKQLDLLQTARRKFNFPHNKLEYVAEALGVGNKVEHEGFKLWLKCMQGDTEAWDRMREYNIRDVTLLEDVYAKMLPWIEQHPSIAAITNTDCCPSCGSENLDNRGNYNTKTRSYVQYRCRDCGTYSRATKSSGSVGVTGVAA